MDYNKIKTIVAKSEGVYGWLLRRSETNATTVIRLPGIYSVEDGRFIRSPNPFPREVIHAPGEEFWVTVYSRFTRDGTEYMGEATGQFTSDDEAAVRQTIEQLVAGCRSQSNRPWSLPDATVPYPQVETADPAIAGASRPELVELVQSFSDRVLKATAAEQSVDVSNLEVFLRRFRTRFETSTGLTSKTESTRASVEACFIARVGETVAEHTLRPQARRLADIDPDRLARAGVEYSRGIARAGAPPQHTGAVVLTGEAMQNFLTLENGPLPFHAGARAVHEKMARYEKGKLLSGDAPLKGDGLTLVSDPLVPFGPGSQPYSAADGSPARPVTLVKDGRYDELVGSRRYYEYLGLLGKGEQPSGPAGNTVVAAGSTPEQMLLDGSRVIVVKSFSDFRVDGASGDFASEVRLGEIREDGKAVPFRGGLLIGNWFAALADIRLSSETIKQDGYYGPSAIRVGNLQVAG